MSKSIVLVLLAIMPLLSFSQNNNFQLPISINSDGSDPHESALLEIKSTDKGILIPRVADASALVPPISGFAEGLLVYQTGGDSGFYYFNSSSWQKIGGSSGGDNLGNHTATQALQLATMTTVQRDMITPSAGMLIYNTDVGRPQFYKEDDPITQIDVDNNSSTETGCTSIAQSFSLNSTLLVTEIKAKIDFNGNANDVTLKIYENDGNSGTVAYTETFNLASIPVENTNEYRFILTTALSVPVSQDRTFEITQSGNNNMTAHVQYLNGVSYNVTNENSPDPQGKFYKNGVNSDTDDTSSLPNRTIFVKDLDYEVVTQNKQWVTQ